MRGRVRVYITIDTECAEERGSAPAVGFDLRVWGRFVNQRRSLGIELIMDELERHDLRGTFFTEALGSAYFGEPGLAEACRAMVQRGHDVQLHAHPRQTVANWRTLDQPPADDDIGNYPLDEQVALLRRGIAILERCGVPAGSVRAFRAGNFGASNSTWQAIAQAGLVVSSNYNPCYFEKHCKLRIANPSAGLFQAEHGVWELPITNFVERAGGARHAQITAVSSGETRALLDDAYRVGIREVTIVTHSFELYHTDSVAEKRGRPNAVNVLRFRALCAYLAQHRDRFEIDTVGALAKRIQDGVEVPPASPELAMPRGRSYHKLRRLAEQTYKRIEQRIPWSLPVV